jgi:hypothetical protein
LSGEAPETFAQGRTTRPRATWTSTGTPSVSCDAQRGMTRWSNWWDGCSTLRQALRKQLPKVKTPREQESLRRTIAATDAQIDALVYELYGLSEDEIRIVEGGSN